MKLIEIDDGMAVLPQKVVVLKRADDKCVIWTAGQSAVDEGFLVDRDYDELLDEMNEALEDDEADQNER